MMFKYCKMIEKKYFTMGRYTIDKTGISNILLHCNSSIRITAKIRTHEKKSTTCICRTVSNFL